ncbi:MAG: ubiquinol-cytochrome c reductase iron-sulfur subunit [Nocardioidaceae bacterium]
MGSNVSRRTVLAAGPGVVGLGVLAGCGGGQGSPGSAGSAGASPKGSRVLAKVADIPVGEAVSATDPAGKPLIVSRPSDGEVVAFSAICTHMGCTVAPDGKILKCPCHGSTYDPATGKNTGGPAPRPLSRVPVVVRGGDVVES